jgi:hypothetical protein
VREGWGGEYLRVPRMPPPDNDEAREKWRGGGVNKWGMKVGIK